MNHDYEAKEDWKTIPIADNLFEASSWGNIRSKKRKIVDSIGRKYSVGGNNIKLIKTPEGYLKVTFSIFQNKQSHLVHRLVAMAFFGASEMTVNHKDSNPLNNRIGNLEYATSRENCTHHFAQGKSMMGFVKTKYGTYNSRISINGKMKFLGTYKTKEEAHAAYRKEAEKLGEARYIPAASQENV